MEANAGEPGRFPEGRRGLKRPARREVTARGKESNPHRVLPASKKTDGIGASGSKRVGGLFSEVSTKSSTGEHLSLGRAVSSVASDRIFTRRPHTSRFRAICARHRPRACLANPRLPAAGAAKPGHGRFPPSIHLPLIHPPQPAHTLPAPLGFHNRETPVH